MHARACLVVLLLTAVPLSGCIVPQNMTALRTDLGYGEAEPTPPLVAKARASTLTPQVNETVTLTAEIEGQPAADASITWTLGDRTVSGTSIEHQFPSPGEITVNLSAHGEAGSQAFDELTLTVQPNRAPIPNITLASDTPLTPEDPVRFSALASTDPDGDALTYQWLVDGEQAGQGPTLNASYTPGAHNVTLIASDATLSAQANDRFAVDQPLQGEAELDVTTSTYTLPFDVAPAAQELTVTLTHSTNGGIDDVQLVLRDGDGDQIAAAETEPAAGASSASEQLTVDGAELAPGTHTLEAHLDRGASASITIEGVLTYSALGGATD